MDNNKNNNGNVNTVNSDNCKRIAYVKPTMGQKAADRVAEVIGSWRFLIIQSIVLFAWVIMNIFAWINHWDPYPFILLNLALSFQAAYAAPIILMSQNRAAERDRKKSEADLATDRKAEREIKEIQEHLKRLENGKIKNILEILEKE